TLPGVGVFNMAVREEGGEVIFLRTVVAGVADRSYGIQVARLAGLPDRVTRRAAEILRELEAPGAATAGEETERSSLLPVQIPLPGLGLAPESPIDLLNELLALDPAELTPLEALNRIWEIQRRAGRR
ncbi:MAG TPA: DNA mismatch repair protein MutS, partial [Chloroflexota bacterium]|nr:DNA mismatch repair protein MutS [Chloroflexota bacterium]